MKLWISRMIPGLVVMALTGCTTYVERPAPVYVQPTAPPPPPVAYEAQPPVAYNPQPAPPPVTYDAQAEAPAPEVQEAPAPPPPVIQSESDFNAPLAPLGHWVEVEGYGRCWAPGGVAADWRPYSNGHWEMTDAGWFWVSDEPWGWATYHYGRWDYRDDAGWFWIPQTQWAPAWVSWRRGGECVGWAPLPPSRRFDHGVRVEVEVNLLPPPRAFVFVEERHFMEPHRTTTVIVNNNVTYNRTVNITNVKVVNKTVVNVGPPAAAIEKSTGRTIRPVTARDLRTRQETVAVRNAPAARPVVSRETPPNVNRQPVDSRPADSRPATRPVPTQKTQAPAARPSNPPAITPAQKPAPQPQRPPSGSPQPRPAAPAGSTTNGPRPNPPAGQSGPVAPKPAPNHPDAPSNNAHQKPATPAKPAAKPASPDKDKKPGGQ